MESRSAGLSLVLVLSFNMVSLALRNSRSLEPKRRILLVRHIFRSPSHKRSKWLASATDPNSICLFKVSVTLRLTESEETLKLWAYKFVLDITVELIASGPQKASLRMQISVENKSSSPLSFTTAMHTYFTAPHIHDVAITPLQQHNYFDKLSNSEKVQEEAAVTISSETDRVYYKYVHWALNSVRSNGC